MNLDSLKSHAPYLIRLCLAYDSTSHSSSQSYSNFFFFFKWYINTHFSRFALINYQTMIVLIDPFLFGLILAQHVKSLLWFPLVLINKVKEENLYSYVKKTCGIVSLKLNCIKYGSQLDYCTWFWINCICSRDHAAPYMMPKDSFLQKYWYDFHLY